MDDIDELLEPFRIFYASLAKLREMSGLEILLPGRVGFEYDPTGKQRQGIWISRHNKSMTDESYLFALPHK